jgi:hypothetical protein
MGPAFSAFSRAARGRNMNFPFLCLQTNKYLGNYRGTIGIGAIFGVSRRIFWKSEISCLILLEKDQLMNVNMLNYRVR